MNAAYPIETRTDSLIETSRPSGLTPGDAVSVLKTSAEDGVALIIASFECSSVTGCVPAPEQLSRTFVAYVGGSSSLVVDMPRPDRHCKAPAPFGDPLLLFQ